MDEILLRHRALIDAAVHSLEETTSIDAFIQELDAQVASLRLHEPSFWELRVVEYIHDVVTTELKASLRKDFTTVDAADVARVKQSIRDHLSTEITRLTSGLERSPERRHDANQCNHLLETFWNETAQLDAGRLHRDVEADDGASREAPPEQASYEAISFEDLLFETGSMNSAPSSDEIPVLLEALTNPSSDDRRMGLQRLAQISPMELVHCTSLFGQVTNGLCECLVGCDRGISKQALQLLYSILCHVEDPAQYLDLYFAVIEWVGSNVSTKRLSVAANELFSDSEEVLQAVDAFRFWHLLMCRVPYHWIHLSTEMVATVLCSTFVVLMLDPPSNNQRLCRPIEVVSLIDPDAKWFEKWALKVPSRAQFLANLDETCFLSDFMYALTRLRPLEHDPEPLEYSRATHALTILTIVARSERGRSALKSWMKLPAHLQQQRRYTQWLGVEKQFRLDPACDENDWLYSFKRMDRSITNAHGMELEDGGPLGDQAITAIALSSVVICLFDRSGVERTHLTLRTCGQSILELPGHQDALAQLFDVVVQCGVEKPRPSKASLDSSDELESQDPWFPLRRPKSIETVTKYVLDAAIKRGLPSSPSMTRKCAQVVECLVDCTATLTSVTPRLASALANALSGFVDHLLLDDTTKGVRDEGNRTVNIIMSLTRMLSAITTPATLGSALVDQGAHMLSRLVQISQNASCTRAVFDLVTALTQSSASLRDIVERGLWSMCLHHHLNDWQSTGDANLGFLHLLLLPSTIEGLCSSDTISTLLTAIERQCLLDLEMGVALNSAPTEAPIQLRMLCRAISYLRAALGSQFAAIIFTLRQTKFCEFITRSVLSHRHGVCHPTPDSEDLCTVVFDLITAVAGCVPSVIGFYELMGHLDVRSIEPENDRTISACAWLASSVASSLAHVGGYQDDWIRPQPLYQFSDVTEEENTNRRRVSTTNVFKFKSTTIAALEQMHASIDDSKCRHESLDMAMLSQATWEVLADVEKLRNRDPDRYRTLTKAFGKLIYTLVISGRSKIGEELSSEALLTSNTRKSVTNAEGNGLPSFPSDAERKLMNTYYKAYCARLGLKSTPTMLHVLSKVFGSAAMDCFSCTLLMILDQAHSEQEIVDMLLYCKSCPSIYVLWPRIKESQDIDIPVLLPVAQAAELILEVEFPQIFTTLRQCHCSVLTLVLRWHSQCYWNYLPWDNILMMVYLSFLYGVEFQVYFFVAVVKHFEPTIRAIITKNGSDPARAYVETLQAPIEGFRFHTSRNLFLSLRSTYHDRIQEILHKG